MILQFMNIDLSFAPLKAGSTGYTFRQLYALSWDFSAIPIWGLKPPYHLGITVYPKTSHQIAL